MTIFDGYQLSLDIEAQLANKVVDLKRQQKPVKIGAILFTEDQGSLLYTQLKKEAAARVGIDYQVDNFSMRDDPESLASHLEQLNNDPTVTGIIIQKPWTSTWAQITSNQREDFINWWKFLTDKIDQSKDVDGLTSKTLASIKDNSFVEKGYVMPATAKAVIRILDQAGVNYESQKFDIIGRSDLLGKPLFYWLKNQGASAEMLGSQELEARSQNGQYLRGADVVISSTGRSNLITAEMIQDGAVVIDVGEPKGDVDFDSVKNKASFITPVPGGVGPMTVVCLLENAVELVDSKNRVK